MPKAKNTDTPDPIEHEPSPANRGDVPEDVRADLAPTVPPKWDSAMEDPEHPLHHHAKRDSLESPTTE